MSDVRTLERIKTESAATNRLRTTLLAVFAGLAVAVVGGRHLRRDFVHRRPAHARARRPRRAWRTEERVARDGSSERHGAGRSRSGAGTRRRAGAHTPAGDPADWRRRARSPDARRRGGRRWLPSRSSRATSRRCARRGSTRWPRCATADIRHAATGTRRGALGLFDLFVQVGDVVLEPRAPLPDRCSSRSPSPCPCRDCPARGDFVGALARLLRGLHVGQEVLVELRPLGEVGPASSACCGR